MLRELLRQDHPGDTFAGAALAEDASVPSKGGQRDFQVGFD
jgi:hypothetical protein